MAAFIGREKEISLLRGILAKPSASVIRYLLFIASQGLVASISAGFIQHGLEDAAAFPSGNWSRLSAFLPCFGHDS